MNRTSYEQRVRTARSIGADAAERCTDKAAANDPMFSVRALDFIVAHVKKHGPVSGEDTTLAAVQAGIRPHDLRAFGSLYAKAIRDKQIRVVGEVRRTKGHGSRGGSVYAPGEAANGSI